MKKKLMLIVMMMGLIFTMVPPVETHAESEIDKINKEIKKLQQQQRSAMKKQQEAEKNVKQAKVAKERTASEITVIMAQINDVTKDMMDTSVQIDQTEDKLRQTAVELEEATERVQSRSQLLDSRLRLMYTNGFVSYLDVLLDSTSFSDFLDRIDMLKSVVGQDKDILADNKRDKLLVIEKKKQVEVDLKQVRALYSKMDLTKQDLAGKEKQKEVMIASLSKQIEEGEEISEEQEKFVMELAKKTAALQEKKKKFKPKYKGGKLGMPIQTFRLSSGFGPRTHPVTGQKGKMHTGLDFAAPKGTSIYAAEAGIVIVAQTVSGYGNCVIINHGNGLWTLYGHIRNGGILVEKGQEVKKGQKIAEVGSTGQSTGNHLHFEVRVNEVPKNPTGYLNL
ncbi:murein hydrolase activator EnvC family protein [Paenibacillus guangzhouensis]|uniref:murein hydrolase activator EnvC family protein n=1 Tax=Paenibacillus guangzhouensis TaxID=1473112 RepID=UPI001267225A|nr:M23 family metallopeptidase [Paenibacillus guangzhouensis]